MIDPPTSRQIISRMEAKRKTALSTLAFCIVALCVSAVFTMQVAYLGEMEAVAVRRARQEGIPLLLTQYRARRKELMRQGQPRSLVCSPIPETGLGNKAMHLVSCVALCVATDRVLYLEWPERHASAWTYVWKVISQGEDTYSQSTYSSLFKTFFDHVEIPDAGLEPQRENNTLRFPFPADDENGIYSKTSDLLRYGNISATMPCHTLYVQGWNFWGKAIFENAFYENTSLASMGAEAFFTFTARALLQPIDDYKAPEDCGWLIHYRVHRNQVASIADFEECAVAHGFRAQQGTLNLLMSDGDASIPGFTAFPRGCRTGYRCDIEAVHQLHGASACRRAILTYESSFGQLAASMGNITDAWEVKPDGSCQRRGSTLPNVIY